jgi:HAMP domain-containing protein
MLRSFPYIALAAAAIAVCLLGLSWLMTVWLGRHLSVGELVVAGVLLVAALVYGLSAWRSRNRRKVQDMRDSALW